MEFPWLKKNNNQPNQLSSSSSTTTTTTEPQTQNQNIFLNIQNQFSSFCQHSIQWPQPHHHHFPNFIQTFQTAISTFTSTSFPKKNPPHFAHLSSAHNKQPIHRFDLAMATEDIEERLAGIPVYALSNSDEEFVLISGVKTGKSLGLLCFSKNDADTLLEQMKSMDPGMRQSSKVVAVALNKVFQLKLDGVAFRFIPDSSQIKNAIQVNQNAGLSDQGFSGVPVFQSQSLVLKSQDKRYRPIFFRKEDLENSLRRASIQQKQLNPAFRQGDIQVSVLEEIIKTMKCATAGEADC
ncbi:hypothetical protein AQUCO_05800151v1 [Aquilegia coerulea]|uniref:Tic22-like protein n=1 Tax=Aquilegia coerulea TaxID=218851 RepID=A0A2G5CF67_AQUCA|nr:hypothetical protein AQUCO_05800151v1 [Aquilegia coerulea]